MDDQADLSLCWMHRSFCWLCHAAAQMFSLLQAKSQGSTSSNVKQMFNLVFDKAVDKEKRIQVRYFISFSKT